MPTTPKLLLPYPVATDPADVPADVQRLAAQVDTVAGANSGLATLDASGKIPASQLPTGSAGPTYSYGTTPPASPVDGDFWLFPADAANGVIWKFRYRAAASTYKWEFVGGSPLYAFVAADAALAGTNIYSWPATPGPDIVVPRSGDYRGAALSRSGPNAVGGTVHGGIANASLGTNAIGATSSVQAYATGAWVNVPVEAILSGVNAGQTLRQVWWATAAGTTVGQRVFELWPIRVS